MFEQLASIHPLLAPGAAGVIALLVGAIVVDLVAKHLLVGAVRTFAKLSRSTWDDALVAHNVIGRLVQVLPALIVFVGVSFISGLPESVVLLFRNVAMGYMVLMLTLGLTGMLSAANTIYSASPIARHRPLKGFVQLIQIIIWILGGIMIIAAMLDRSPILLLSGFGAMTAILLLVFKDTILSLVASVQLTAQDMVARRRLDRDAAVRCRWRCRRRAAAHGQGAELGQDH